MNKLKLSLISLLLCLIFVRTAFANEGTPSSRVKGRWAFGLNYPGLLLKYGVSNRLAVDLHLQAELQSGDYNVIVTGPRLYLYLNPTSPLILYFAGDINYVQSEWNTREEYIYATGNIFAGSFGLEIFLSQRITFLAEIGYGRLSLKDKETDIARSNFQTVANFGLNFYTRSLKQKDEERKRREEEQIEILAEEERRLAEEEGKRQQEAEEHFNAGKEASNRGDFETAIQEFKLVLQLKPDSEPARNFLEEAKRKRQEQARKLAEEEAKRLREEEERRKRAEAREKPVEIETPKKRFNVAILDLGAQNVSQMDAAVVKNFIQVEMINTGAVTVLERASMDKILAEQKFQMTGCTTRECAVEIGKILNVQKVVIGNFSKALGTYYISAQIVDIESGESEVAQTTRVSSPDDLQPSTEELARELIRKLLEKHPQQ